MRHARKIVTSSLGGALVAACVVPNVELVDQLPGGGSAGKNAAGSASRNAGGSETAGTPPDGEGGEPMASGGEGPLGGASTAGSAGTAGVGGPFPAISVCDTDGGFAWCEPFTDKGAVNTWNSPPLVVACDTGDQCPSAPGYLQAQQEPSPDLDLNLELGAKVSFWARFEIQMDEVFINFYINSDLRPVKFGVEGDHYRWRFGNNTDGERSAPSSPQKSPYATAGTWACIELVRSESALKARVVPFGKKAVELPVVDFEATAGEDDTWVPFYPAPSFDFTGQFSFGQSGSESVFIDEIAIGPLDSLSTCDHYLQSSP
jgi:hypothetical protein